jgi:hypothetical protein
VDFVIETGGKLLPIEVKSTTRPRLSDAKYLRTFRTEYGKKSRAGCAGRALVEGPVIAKIEKVRSLGCA